MKKLKLIELTILMAVIVLLGDDGCDSSCLDFNSQLSHLFGLSHYVYCEQITAATPTTPAAYVALQTSVGAGLPNAVETYSPAGGFDCGTSMNGQAPLPHPKSWASVVSPAGSSSGAGLPRDPRPAAQPFTYRPYGYNNGFVPPSAILPNIPVPSTSSASIPVSCPPNPPDALVVNHLHNTVTRLGTCPFSTKATIPVGSRPLQVAVTPDATLAVVTSFDNAVNFINLSSNGVAFTLNTDASINPAGVAITPDGKKAYITSFNNIKPVILVIDIGSHAILATIPVGNWPQVVAITPDGSQAWVSYPFQNSIDIFDTLTNTETGGRIVASPAGIAFNSTGTRAYVASGGNPGTVVAFDTATLKQIATYTVGTIPVDVVVDPGGRFVVTNNFASANLSIIDTVTGMVVTGASNGKASLGLVPIF